VKTRLQGVRLKQPLELADRFVVGSRREARPCRMIARLPIADPRFRGGPVPIIKQCAVLPDEAKDIGRPVDSSSRCMVERVSGWTDLIVA
jgi:hypothetical protein